ncbi:MAG TPA: cysteine--tRNA ligase [Opitutaceae bacterium]|nr:cysteine--tRNA ligase [Opitutaceae bacterium]
MAIKLFDSLTRAMRELRPAHADGVFRFYNCGPTVYAPAHIGNFRAFVVNDVLRRMLELEFPGKVRHVRNLTDVDDRSIGQALQEGRPLAEITRRWTQLFHSECASINCLPPHVEPSATGHIREQVDMIDVLMRKGNAYRAPNGSVYFKISSFPAYGALSRIRERELKVTNSVFDADHKDDLGDFALWKAYKPEEDGDVKWPGPVGAAEGRPGWHIECSAMIKKHLGETIDLHTGGVDLLFPHHENEIAQSQCCNGAALASHWYHNEHLLVDGAKMSKSRGNYYTLGDLVGKGHSPVAVRFALLAGHPRKQLNFTLDSLHAAASALGALRRFSQGLGPAAVDRHPGAPSGVFDAALAALADDLNLPAALGALFAAVNGLDAGAVTQADRAAFERVLYALGLEIPFIASGDLPVSLPPEIADLASRRLVAKKARDFATADRLRAELAAAGWTVRDGKDGSTLEPVKKA